MVFRTINTGIVEYGENLLPFTAEEDVLRGQLVKSGAASVSVEPSDTDGETAIGVATQTVSAGDEVTVAVVGCEVLMTSGTGTVSSGDLVASHGGTGEEGEIDTAATGDTVVGQALEDDAGVNDDVRVMLTGPGGEVN